MMNYIWALIIILSIIFACFTGDISTLSDALLTSGNEALTLGITLAGGMCLWGGLMQVADKAGITTLLSRMFSPLLRKILPGITPDSPAEKAVTMNVAANLLGLGNAATPLGLKAMKELHTLSNHSQKASPAMISFVVLNTASIQLIPSTVALLRTQSGAANSLDILPCVWLASITSVVVGLTISILFRKK